ncbi:MULTISPECIES: SMP-30/gluconolactonase/LRE family protein [unclassified Pseudomonas]|uniref:SMP-30/gluconolactonase/LRE family protein n=1 Tax=unclassified Pseudomonas TaxID=196821 RepID=UPI000D353FBA|nr:MULTISPECIES: SMP-30/gluconolactonase/LRE family protein [unclassified Pseudomonas]RAU44817.1 SMP-30/gluconolactonase/LRE family protein [Pseudomonas sp. RIT 409]RAU53612.1 SMP-30/gluconolactonase/LRE family protein [Pseudomonas sp. RIT 412]
MQAELILDARNATGESPVWHVQEQALYWVDIPAGRLHRWRISDGRAGTWTAPNMLACIASQGDGSWLAGMEDGLYRIHPNDDGTLASDCLTHVAHPQANMRFNDGRCDRQGRFWAGTMAMDMAAASAVGSLYRYTEDQREPLRPALCDMLVPNGLGFSPDGRVMYLSDSHPSVQRIWAFDYDIDSGTPHNRRLFVDMNHYPGRPDGAAVDADGCYWICGNDAGLIHRFTPAGKLDRSLSVPVKKPAMCAFGGRDLSTLFVTSIRPGGDISDQPLAGGVFALRPGVEGMAESHFGG